MPRTTSLLTTFGLGLALGLAFLPWWVSAHGDHADHSAHDHDGPDDELTPMPQQAQYDVPWDEGGEMIPPGPFVNTELNDCVWRRDTGYDAGTITADCEGAELPVSVGIFQHDPEAPFDMTVNFAQAERRDAVVDGLILTEQHHPAHGELIPDDPARRELAAYAWYAMPERGHATHIRHTPGRSAHFRYLYTLCCEVAP